MLVRKNIFFIGILILLFSWNTCVWAEEEEPAEERPAFELPEVVIIGEDQSRVIIGGKRQPLIDQPFLEKVEGGVEPVGKLSPLSFLPPRKENITEFSFGYGSFNTIKSSLSHGRQIRDKGYYLLGIGKSKTDGEFPGRRYNEDSAFLELGFKPGENLDLKVAANGLFKDYRLANSPDTQKVDLFNVELGFEGRVKEGSSLGCQLFGQIAEVKNNYKAKSEIGGALLRASIGLAEKNSLSLEGGVYQEELKLGGDRRRHLISSISLSDEFLLFDRLWVNLGVEYKEKSKPFTYFLSPAGGLSYELVSNFNLWVKYKPEMSVPPFDELYIKNDYTAVNLDLLPQKRRFSLEEGMEYKVNQNLSGSISFFQRKFKNFIALSDDGTIGNWQNISNVFSQGVEASLVYNLGEYLTQSLRYVYEGIEDEDRPDEKVPYRPSHSLRLSSYLGMIEVSVLMQSKRYYDRSHSLPTYWTLGTEIYWDLWEYWRIGKGFLLFFQAENLLQEKYAERFGYPLEHTKYLGGFKVKF